MNSEQWVVSSGSTKLIVLAVVVVVVIVAVVVRSSSSGSDCGSNLVIVIEVAVNQTNGTQTTLNMSHLTLHRVNVADTERLQCGHELNRQKSETRYSAWCNMRRSADGAISGQNEHHCEKDNRGKLQVS